MPRSQAVGASILSALLSRRRDGSREAVPLLCPSSPVPRTTPLPPCLLGFLAGVGWAGGEATGRGRSSWVAEPHPQRLGSLGPGGWSLVLSPAPSCREGEVWVPAGGWAGAQEERAPLPVSLPVRESAVLLPPPAPTRSPQSLPSAALPLSFRRPNGPSPSVPLRKPWGPFGAPSSLQPPL